MRSGNCIKKHQKEAGQTGNMFGRQEKNNTRNAEKEGKGRIDVGM
jgi:hypothetical protein